MSQLPSDRATPQADSGVRFPPPLIFLCLGLVGWLAERAAGVGAIVLSAWAAWPLAGALTLIAAVLLAGALTRFRRAGTPPEPWKPTTALTRQGIYGRTRNPMYLGMACLQLAVGIALLSGGIVVATLPALLIVDRFVVRREEAYLLDRFGDPYADYLASVRRWL